MLPRYDPVILVSARNTEAIEFFKQTLNDF